ncbi:MAG: AbrB/MazE/SpoVT family DNA-binding domain-containing protein [Clostridiales bacterium]|jgi:transcriptional pleiotropic regulator of transition state genes|nr:AbrB/MazE/SpoVT family DNA-binding domain-containing protein [Clostridiales bacterium]
MHATGIVRKLDELGRIVLPKELRKTLGLNIKDPIEIYVNENEVVLKKYEPDCIFCGGMTDIKTYKSKNVCKNCRKELGTNEK